MGVGIPLPKVPDKHFILIMEHRDTEMFNINTKALRNKVFYRNKENKRHDTVATKPYGWETLWTL